MRSKILTALIVLAVVLTAHASAAQTFTSSKLQPGATIEVKPLNARASRGTLTSVTAARLTLRDNGIERTFTTAGITRVDVIGDDTLWNGVRQGYKVSAPYWLLGSAMATPCKHKPYVVLCLVGFQLAAGAPFATAGAVADALHDGRTTVFRSEADAAAASSAGRYKLTGAAVGAGIGAVLGSRLCGERDGCNVHDRIASAFWLAELFALVGGFIGSHSGAAAGSHVSPNGPPAQIQFGFSF
jgi:hypothetical protein